VRPFLAIAIAVAAIIGGVAVVVDVLRSPPASRQEAIAIRMTLVVGGAVILVQLARYVT